MTRSFLTLLALIGLFCHSSVLTAQEKYTITPRFEPGKYVQTLVVNTDAVTRAGAGDLDSKGGIPMKQAQTQKQFLEVSPPDDQGIQKMKVTFSEIKMDQTVMGMKMVYDSMDKDRQDPKLAPALQAMLGTEITFDLTKDGKKENVKGFDELWEKMAKSMPGNIPAEMFKSMKENMSDEKMSNMLGGFENNFGREPRAVGEQWVETQSQIIPFFGKSEIESTHTLKSVQDDVAVIATEGKIKTQGGKAIEMGPVKMNVEKGDMSIVTTTSVNIKTGLAFETRSEINMDMTATMDMPRVKPSANRADETKEDTPVKNAPPMKMHITSKGDSTVTIEKVEY
ncbi:MAG: DUF6263 family protein [Planctomycetaceae bacterium]|nr:DUF6263 family protein [Planctomycetaceae bacterium]